jgi:2-iminobutanoate/2-iminopropanoate deaminase
MSDARLRLVAVLLASSAMSTGSCALLRSSTDLRREVRSDAAPAPIGPYSQAVEARGTLYVSGQIGVDPATGALAVGGIEAQTRRAFANLEAVLKAANYSAADVVQATVYLVDLGDFEVLNAVYAEFFGSTRPARATVGVSALPRGARVEIALVAVRARE